MTLEIQRGNLSTPEQNPIDPANYFVVNDQKPSQVDLFNGSLLAELGLQDDSPPPDLNPSGRAKHDARPRFKVREATEEDIPKLVEIDLRAFKSVYESGTKTNDEIRAEQREIFKGRLKKVGGKWLPVVTTKNFNGEDEIIGSMTCCPTSEGPSSFESWEKATDNGTLSTLYDENGKNVYIVALTMDPKVRGRYAQNQLFLNQIGYFITQGGQTAFFESRMPGFRRWAKNRYEDTGVSIDRLDEADKLSLANEYFGLTQKVGRKQVPRDPLLRMYKRAGCNLLRVYSDAYQDAPSMNFGVLCTYENPLGNLGDVKVLGKTVGGLAMAAANSSSITRRLFR